MSKKIVLTVVVLTVIVSVAGAGAETEKDYPIRPVVFTDVRIEDEFGGPPGHEEIEIGLCKLYRPTGDEKGRAIF
ncbi:MAG: hypothetical protein ACYST6_01095 [Planctomycetota bacterium]|jgi:hypothetical protein